MTHVEHTPKHPGGRPRIYPWLELDVGESFLVLGKSERMISRLGRRWRPRRFRCKTIVCQGVKGVRVWRIE